MTWWATATSSVQRGRGSGHSIHEMGRRYPNERSSMVGVIEIVRKRDMRDTAMFILLVATFFTWKSAKNFDVCPYFRKFWLLRQLFHGHQPASAHCHEPQLMRKTLIQFLCMPQPHLSSPFYTPWLSPPILVSALSAMLPLKGVLWFEFTLFSAASCSVCQ